MGTARHFYKQMPPVNFNFADAKETDVSYKYLKNAMDVTGKILTTENIEEENLDKTIPTVLLIHGWMTDDTGPWFDSLKDELFQLGPHNIFYINWYEAANAAYENSCANIKPIGKFIAEFLMKSRIPQENIHLIAHSLGCHLASFVAKETFELSGKKVGRITGLDPAGPKFENSPRKSRLHSVDANFVDVVHTDIQHFGFTSPLGHVDFYPNEGKHQPGCPRREKDVNCSHMRSTYYFIESISRKCKAKEAFFKEVNDEVTIKIKDDGKEAIFGYHVDKLARGIFYFETNSQTPFLC